MKKYINIDSKGYGKIYKAVTRNRELPLIAKAIYAYICSYAGNGTTAFPSRSKITNDLKINKDTCTKHLNTLCNQGYLSKQRTITNNLYTIIQDVKEFDNPFLNSKKDSDVIVFKNIRNLGYGTIPKLLMFDERLTAQAKAIYSYFASFAGAGTSAFPTGKTILRELGISQNTYYKHFNLLVEFGYITTNRTTSNGRFSRTIYELESEIEWHDDAMSEKVIDGKNILTKTKKENHISFDFEKNKVVENSKPMSEKVMSEKLMSEKVIHDNFGHTNINNNTYNKQYNNKHVYNNHNQRDDVENNNLITIENIKHWIDYDNVILDMEASPSIRKLCGTSDNGSDDLLYIKVYKELIENLPMIILDISKDYDLLGKFSVEQIKILWSNDNIRDKINDIMDNYLSITSTKHYFKKAIKNFVKEYF